MSEALSSFQAVFYSRLSSLSEPDFFIWCHEALGCIRKDLAGQDVLGGEVGPCTIWSPGFRGNLSAFDPSIKTVSASQDGGAQGSSNGNDQTKTITSSGDPGKGSGTGGTGTGKRNGDFQEHREDDSNFPPSKRPKLSDELPEEGRKFACPCYKTGLTEFKNCGKSELANLAKVR